MLYSSLPQHLRIEMTFAQLCHEISENGIAFNSEECEKLIEALQLEIDEIDKKLLHKLPKISKALPPLKAGHAIRKWMSTGQPYRMEGNELHRWQVDEPNPNSMDQLREYLLSLGWKPSSSKEAWNYKKIKNKFGKLVEVKDEQGNLIKTTPKIPSEDEELEKLGKLSPDFKLISERIQRRHRLSTLQGYASNLRDDKRIPMHINPCGANTMRVRHSVVANVPRIGSFYGEQLRSLFTTPDNRVMVGSDCSGLEACMLAHYLGDQGFIDFIIKNDFKYHKYFYNILQNYVSSYDLCKGLDFAFIFGASDHKLGTLCDLAKSKNPKTIGAEVRKLMMKEIPGLEQLKETLESQFERNSGIYGIDGRLIKCRKKSALINTACQSAGAIVAKTWTCKYRKDIELAEIDSKHVIFYHDSNTEETLPELGDTVGKIMIDGIAWAGEFLKLKLPVTGVYSVGKNWAEVK